METPSLAKVKLPACGHAAPSRAEVPTVGPRELVGASPGRPGQHRVPVLLLQPWLGAQADPGLELSWNEVRDSKPLGLRGSLRVQMLGRWSSPGPNFLQGLGFPTCKRAT